MGHDGKPTSDARVRAPVQTLGTAKVASTVEVQPELVKLSKEGLRRIEKQRKQNL